MGNNIILCGFMGCGKTRVGKQLRKDTGREFVDIDYYIEHREGMRVSEIFEKFGEEEFRKKENEAVKILSKRKNLIIACGGGTVLREENVNVFHETGGVIVFLNVPVVVLQERLKNDTKRPLLQTPDRNKVIWELHKERYPKYREAADVSIYAAMPCKRVSKRILGKEKIRAIL